MDNLTDAQKLARVFDTLAFMGVAYSSNEGAAYRRALYACMLAAQLDVVPIVADELSEQAAFNEPERSISEAAQERVERQRYILHTSEFERFQTLCESMDARDAMTKMLAESDATLTQLANDGMPPF